MKDKKRSVENGMFNVLNKEQTINSEYFFFLEQSEK